MCTVWQPSLPLSDGWNTRSPSLPVRRESLEGWGGAEEGAEGEVFVSRPWCVTSIQHTAQGFFLLPSVCPFHPVFHSLLLSCHFFPPLLFFILTSSTSPPLCPPILPPRGAASHWDWIKRQRREISFQHACTHAHTHARVYACRHTHKHTHIETRGLCGNEPRGLVQIPVSRQPAGICWGTTLKLEEY